MTIMLETRTENRQLTLVLHGAVCRLETAHIPFLAYAKEYLADFVAEGKASPEVQVRLHWDAAPPKVRRNGTGRRWGRRLLQSDSNSDPRLLQTEILHLPGLQLDASWSGGRLFLDAYYRPSTRWERLGHRLKRGNPRVFVTLIYYLVYFPLIHYLEQTRGWHLLHAGAVSRPDGAWVLAGLPGSGKSTFTLALLADPQARLLSDNLLLFDEEQVYACPEPIHLSADSRQLLPSLVQARLADADRDFSHGRRDFRLPPEAREWTARPRTLLFLGLADQADCRPLSTEVALNRLLAFDQLAKEVNAYAQFAAALELIAPRPGQAQAHRMALESLVSYMACYELWLEKGSGLQTLFADPADPEGFKNL